eukprot:COSAG01_NODE_969_length_12378_cov_41.649320_13_plen_111_part_00
MMSGRWRWDGLHHEALLWQRVRDRHHAGWERQRVRLQEPLPQRRLPRLESLSIHCEGGGGGGGGTAVATNIAQRGGEVILGIGTRTPASAAGSKMKCRENELNKAALCGQ